LLFTARAKDGFEQQQHHGAKGVLHATFPSWEFYCELEAV